MPNSYVDIPADGVTTLFAFSFPYIDKTHVDVLVDGVATAFTWSGDSAVNVSPAPSNGANVRIIRTTPNTPVVDFQDGENLTEEDLDNVNLQALFLSQEAADGLTGTILLDDDGKLDAQSRVIKNVGTPTAGDEAATKAYVDAAAGVDAPTHAAAAAASAAAAAVSEGNAATSEANAASSAASIVKTKHYYRASNTNYTSSVLAGGAENYVQHSDIFAITPTLPNSEIIVISSSEVKITNLDGDDDFRAYVGLRYKNSGGLWQSNNVVDNHSEAPLGVVNVDGNTVMGSSRSFSTMFTAMSRFGDTQKNAAGNWEIAIFGTAASDPNSEIQLLTAGSGFTIIEVEGGVL